MTGPGSLRTPLADLLRAIEARDEPHASTGAKALIADLENPNATPQPKVGMPGDAPVRFSGLYHALLREVRASERHITTGNWTAAAAAVRNAIGVLPAQG
jgi:hypothetical protein